MNRHIMSITRDQAVCRFFCEDYSKENAAKLSKRIEELGTFDVCYENDSNRPVHVHLSVIRNDPTTFKRYLSECSIVDLEDKVGAKAELVTEREVVMFLNEVYKTTDPKNEALYSMQEIETKKVYESVISKAEFMSKKSEIGFASWCSKRKVNFISAPHTRKRHRGLNLRLRTLYVMKHEFRGNTVVIELIYRYNSIINSFFLL
ncbi:hypothetical protein INT47_009245 [Mucor saturninus]|uniref:Uncharacterized protein n=1 Tax=Mucor saturninus TaxID=64648 RepID=A0A8H7USN9_9FUNG|nr:hypothetical protein INT47_009245 [Mucor saturninus]